MGCFLTVRWSAWSRGAPWVARNRAVSDRYARTCQWGGAACSVLAPVGGEHISDGAGLMPVPPMGKLFFYPDLVRDLVPWR